MKSRTGFVSNSSSSSFIIPKYWLSEHQMDQIRRHEEIKNIPALDGWNISEDEVDIRGYTSMDNFDMRQFLEDIGVNMDKVRWN